jgi:C-terminal processing protease CtpA/Prc
MSCPHKTMSAAVAVILFAALFPSSLSARRYRQPNRELAGVMLRQVAADVRRYYYDPDFHGVDWNEAIRQAYRNINRATSLNDAVAQITAALDSLNDSHTFLIPPRRRYVHDYGFKWQMVGRRCYVIRVRPSGDAAQQGLKPGDEILTVNDQPVSRHNFHQVSLQYDLFQPQNALRLGIVDSTRHRRPLEVKANFQPSPVFRFQLPGSLNPFVLDTDSAQQLRRPRYFENDSRLLVVKFPEFMFSPAQADEILARMRAHRAVILDLRGNRGGLELTLEHLLGGLFQHDIPLGARVSRQDRKPVFVTGRPDAFNGRLVVLIDSDSASAAEIFARVVQLQKRGSLVGDRTAGSVREAQHYRHQILRSSYAISVTTADLLMSDGKSLEHIGVKPDIQVLPSSRDLANGWDPAMAKAAALLGASMTSGQAAALFPFEGYADR